MRRWLVSLAVLLALAGAAQAAVRATTARKPVLAATASGLTYHVFHADPISLRPVAGGRSLATDGFMAASQSPDGTWLAVVRNDGAAVRFVRLATMRLEGKVQFGRLADVHPIAWLSERLLVASTGFPGSTSAVVGIDARLRKVVWRRPLHGVGVLAEGRARDNVVLVLGASKGSAPASLLLVSAGGRARSVALERVVAGASDGRSAGTLVSPGLAIDASTNRAYVVDADALVAQVDLGAMTVAYHGGGRTFAKVMAGRARQAIWLGNGMLAVTGSDASVSTVEDGMGQFASTPAGLYLVNAATGAARLVQRDAAAATVVGSSLLAFGVGYGSGADKETGSGVTVYGIDGTLRAHFFGTTPVRDVRVQGGLAYVSLPDRTGHIAVVDPASGRVLRTVNRPTLQVLAG